jgi:hypothetical protein
MRIKFGEWETTTPENPEEFGRRLVEIVETYRETYGVDDPQYSIGFCEYDIEVNNYDKCNYGIR